MTRYRDRSKAHVTAQTTDPPPERLSPEGLRDTLVALVKWDGRDLSSRQLAVLLICYLGNQPQTVRGLAKRMGIPKPSVTRAFDRLEIEKLAIRMRDPIDRRSTLLGRTADGQAYVARLRGALTEAAGGRS